MRGEWSIESAGSNGARPAHARPQAGYVLMYRPGHRNFCPACGQSHWYLGRHTAECAWCAAALSIAPPEREESAAVRTWRDWLLPPALRAHRAA